MKKQLLETLKKAKNYTLAVVEAMPESHFTFKPDGAGWNFAELLNHIGYGIQWWRDNYLLGKQTDWDQPFFESNKAAVKTYLEQSFQQLEETCQELSFDRNSELEGLHATLDHVTHHRGQAVLYLRCQGTTPPEYIY